MTTRGLWWRLGLAAAVVLPLMLQGCGFEDIAGQVGAVQGIVADVDGRPLNSALITVQGSGYSALSNNDGRYLINLPSGAHSLTAAKEGYESLTLPVTVRTPADGGTDAALYTPMTLDFALKSLINPPPVGKLELKLAADGEVYHQGDVVRMKLLVANRQSVPVQLGGGPAPYGFYATDSLGRVIWRLDVPIDALIVLSPGEERTFEGRWAWTEAQCRRPILAGQEVILYGVVRPLACFELPTPTDDTNVDPNDATTGGSDDGTNHGTNDGATGGSTGAAACTSPDQVRILPVPMPYPWARELVTEPVRVKLVSSPVDPTVAFKTLEQGRWSLWSERRGLVFRDAAEFKRFWQRHAGEGAQPPEIDFETTMVLAAMGGGTNSPELAVTVVRLERVVPCLADVPATTQMTRYNTGELRCYVEDSRQETAEPLMDVATCIWRAPAPYHMVIAPRIEGHVDFLWNAWLPGPMPCEVAQAVSCN